MLAELRTKLNNARKTGNKDELSILQVIIGETSMIEGRQGQISKEQIEKVIRKLITSNKEVLGLSIAEDAKNKLVKENDYMEALLPKSLSVMEIKNVLRDLGLEKFEKEGHAIGLAMKHCKQNNLVVSGEDVSKAVKELRS